MILPLKSYIRNPPLRVLPKQVATFNALRYSLDICDISYSRLIESLLEISENGKIGSQTFPIIFLDVWSIINNSVIFKKILQTEFKLSFNEPYFKELNKCKNLRDSNQHIDARLSQTLSIDDLPIYGSLSWMKFYPNTNEAIFSSIYSGTITNKKIASVKISNQNNKEIELNEQIQRLEFTSIVREKENGKFIFPEQSILINQVIIELKWWVEHIENEFDSLFKDMEDKGEHTSDFIVQLKGWWIKTNGNTVYSK